MTKNKKVITQEVSRSEVYKHLASKFCSKYPGAYDLIVDVIETVDRKDLEAVLQVTALEVMWQQA